ncbi:restriction endonuclease [Deinococcus sp.]|uniref:restriction endonuclease n=1 Tax=Deinococcus sp. TaxID=47478 RepID=UPI003B5B9BBB
MAVPDDQTLMRPLLEALLDGQAHTMHHLSARIVKQFELTEAELQEKLPSGRQTVYANRIGWAKTYLAKAQAVATPSRGSIQIMERGRELLARVPGRIVQSDLVIYPEFVVFKKAGREQMPPPEVNQSPSSPEEQLDALYAELSAALADELLTQVRALTPQQFEVLVVQLLVAMGYGGSVRDAGQALGRSGDNGIDGMIKQDPLGLDRVYLQAKRWANPVHSSEIRTFAGSLTFHRASKGVFITTSSFSEGAKSTVEQIGNIILIGGDTLAELMIQYGVGVITRNTYLVKKIDSDFFEGI